MGASCLRLVCPGDWKGGRWGFLETLFIVLNQCTVVISGPKVMCGRDLCNMGSQAVRGKEKKNIYIYIYRYIHIL